jgi:transcriptional regulator with XRE-family HTH domain
MVVGSKKEILEKIGKALKDERLRQNMTQTTLSSRSGVALNAVKNLETGSGATLGTFVLVCRSLGKDSWIRSFVHADNDISPIEYVEMLKKQNAKTRKRARTVS